MTDAEIISGLKQNGAERSRCEFALYQSYNYFIREGCKKYSLSADESQIAYSDAIFSVIISIGKNLFEGRSSLKSYLFQIYSNKCVDLVRKNTTNKSSVHNGTGISDMLGQLPDGAKNAVEKMMQKYQLSVIAEKLKEIGEKCREMLLFFEEGYSDKEIAEKLQYQTAAVAKTSRLRCLDKLREKVKSTISA
jgi:RNA polymerase sigma-70 factor (ECF subfamily)